MADIKTYKEGDTYEIKYPDAPVPKHNRHKVGQQLSIRAKDNMLLALWEVEEVDEKGAKGKIVKVFQVKAPVEPGSIDPRKNRPAANRRTKPL